MYPSLLELDVNPTATHLSAAQRVAECLQFGTRKQRRELVALLKDAHDLSPLDVAGNPAVLLDLTELDVAALLFAVDY